MKGRATGILLAALVASAGPPERSKPLAPPGLGLAAELEKDLPVETERKLMGQLRATGVSVFALPVAWPAAEPSPGKYNVTSVIRAARLLRQSGASVHLDLPLVVGREKTVPADLAQVPFDDSKLSIRLGQLLDALTPALLDCSTLSLGYEADVYF